MRSKWEWRGLKIRVKIYLQRRVRKLRLLIDPLTGRDRSMLEKKSVAKGQVEQPEGRTWCKCRLR